MLHYINPKRYPSKNCSKHIHTYKRGSDVPECWSCYIEQKFLKKEDTRDTLVNNDSIIICNKSNLQVKAKLIKFCDNPFEYYNNRGGAKKLVESFNAILNCDKVGWFAYIKFYGDKTTGIRPLSAGKSGSTSVKSGLPDISFSIDPEYKRNGIIKLMPSRLFLRDYKQVWNMEQILVVKAGTPKEAFNIEAKLMSTFGLFGS